MFNHWLVLSSNLHILKFSTIDVFMFHTYNNCYYGTCGDGNCLYSLLKIIMWQGRSYVRENAHIFWCENIAFSASVSDSALGDGYDRKDPSSRKLVVQRETIRNAKSGTHVSFVCLLALLSVTLYECLFSVPRKVGEGYTVYTQNF